MIDPSPARSGSATWYGRLLTAALVLVVAAACASAPAFPDIEAVDESDTAWFRDTFTGRFDGTLHNASGARGDTVSGWITIDETCVLQLEGFGTFPLDLAGKRTLSTQRNARPSRTFVFSGRAQEGGDWILWRANVKPGGVLFLRSGGMAQRGVNLELEFRNGASVRSLRGRFLEPSPFEGGGDYRWLHESASVAPTKKAWEANLRGAYAGLGANGLPYSVDQTPRRIAPGEQQAYQSRFPGRRLFLICTPEGAGDLAIQIQARGFRPDARLSAHGITAFESTPQGRSCEHFKIVRHPRLGSAEPVDKSIPYTVLEFDPARGADGLPIAQAGSRASDFDDFLKLAGAVLIGVAIADLLGGDGTTAPGTASPTPRPVDGAPCGYCGKPKMLGIPDELRCTCNG